MTNDANDVKAGDVVPQPASKEQVEALIANFGGPKGNGGGMTKKEIQNDKFRLEQHDAIDHFESEKHSWSNCQCYPELFLARIPFLCPVPTAIARLNNVFTITIDPTSSVPGVYGNTFWFNYSPEILFSAGGVTWPFMWTTNDVTGDSSGTFTHSMSKEVLFPNFAWSNISSGRVVGSSVRIVQTQSQVNRTGFGVASRVYGYTDDGIAQTVSKTAVINSIYKDEAIYTNGDSLRMIYAPGDFSDLHLSNMITPATSTDRGSLPVIQGFVQGCKVSPGTASSAPVQITLEFCLVLEYVPKPIVYQMVERKAPVIDSNATSRAANTVAAVTDYGISQGKQIAAQLAEETRPSLIRMGESLAGAARDQFVSMLKSPITSAMSLASHLQPAPLQALVPKALTSKVLTQDLVSSSERLDNNADGEEVRKLSDGEQLRILKESEYIAQGKFVMQKHCK